MNGMWQMWESCIPSDVCDQIVTEAKKMVFQEANITTNLLVNKEVRSSRIAWIFQDNETFSDIWTFLERKFHEANANAFGVDVNYLPNLQFTNYGSDIDGHYDWHVDVFWDDISKPYHRKLSMVVQLNDSDDYTGGNLELDVDITPDQNALRKKGTLIVFPSFVRHRVTKVESGERNSLVGWMEGPAWR